LAKHGVNSRENGDHVIAADDAITIYVVELESPTQLLLHSATAADREAAHKILRSTAMRIGNKDKDSHTLA